MEKLIQFGNKKHIAFELDKHHSSKEMFNLTFYLGGKLISNEVIYAPTYISCLQKLIINFKNNFFYNKKFQGLSYEQIHKTLFEERNSNETQFFKHLLQLDETIDQYNMFIIQNNELVKFIWTCWDKSNCNLDHELNKIYFVEFQIKELLSTLKKLIGEIA